MERRPVTAEVESSSLFRVAAVFTANLISFLLWDLSSAGRASALQAEGHRFEPYRPHPILLNYMHAAVAELADARDLKSRG